MAALCIGQLGAALSTLLVAKWITTRPVELELLNAGLPAILSAGIHLRAGSVGLLAALFAPLPIWLWADLAWFWGGRRFGSRVATWLIKRADVSGSVTRAERSIARGGSWVVGLAPWLPIPAVLLYAAAGWTGLPLARYLLAYLVGTLGRTAAALTIGYAVGRHGNGVLRAVQHWSSLITGVVLGVLLLGLIVILVRRWRRRSRTA